MNWPSSLGLFCFFLLTEILESFQEHDKPIFTLHTVDVFLHLSNLIIFFNILVVQAAMCQSEQFKGY